MVSSSSSIGPVWQKCRFAEVGPNVAFSDRRRCGGCRPARDDQDGLGGLWQPEAVLDSCPAQAGLYLHPGDIGAVFGHGLVKSGGILGFLQRRKHSLVLRGTDDDSGALAASLKTASVSERAMTSEKCFRASATLMFNMIRMYIPVSSTYMCRGFWREPLLAGDAQS